MYNSEKSIERALNSVFNQSYKNYEIIAVNDGSTDHSLELLEKVKNENPQINIQIIDKKNGGVSSARNAGIKNSSGEYISFLDSDDEWLPEKLERQIGILNENPHIDFLGTNRDNEKIGPIFKKYTTLTKISFYTLLFKMHPHASTVVFKKKSIIDDIGYFDDSRRYMEDAEYWFRICKYKNCYFLPERLVITGGGAKAYYGQSGLSSNLWEMEKAELENFLRIYKIGYINLFLFTICFAFSILKYIRRLVIVMLFVKKE